MPGTIATTIMGMKQGIQIHRVHDVKETRQAIDVFEKLNEKWKKNISVPMELEEELETSQ